MTHCGGGGGGDAVFCSITAMLVILQWLKGQAVRVQENVNSVSLMQSTPGMGKEVDLTEATKVLTLSSG